MFDSSTTGTDSDAVLHYLEWDTAYPGFIENKDKADWPQYNSTTNVLDDHTGYLGGELPDLSQDITPSDISSKWTSIRKVPA